MVNVILSSLLVVLAASSEAQQAPQSDQAAVTAIAVPPAGETQQVPLNDRTLESQAPAPLEPLESMSLSGPRVGMTFLSQGVLRKLDEEFDGEFKDVGSVVSQFGWQWEKRLYTNETGLSAVTEWVALVGGMEQGVFIPSVSWLVGVRTVKGVEFAVGPNVTPAGAALVAAAGVTFRAGNLNFPLNLAVVPSKSGVRVSLLAGFNSRR